MEAIIEIISYFIPGKLIAALLCAGLIVAGVYLWTGGNEERALYDAAVGVGSKTYEAEIRRKVVRSESTSGVNDHDTGSVDVNYLDLMYEEDGDYHSIDARVDRDEYDSVKARENIRISFHPQNPDYVVTPMKNRPGVFWYRFGGGIFILLGSVLLLAVIVSVFAD